MTQHLLKVCLILGIASIATAQPVRSPGVRADGHPLHTVFSAETLADLPLGENLYALLETVQPEVISDRFSSAGLNVGESARLGGFLGSWSQTRFLVGDVDISDPSGSGAPLLFPERILWQQVTTWNGMMPADTATPGLGILLEPRRPSARWTATVEGSGSGGGLASQAPGGAVPPISRLREWGHGSALVSGPLSDRAGLVVAGSLSHAAKFSREVADRESSALGSAFAHLVFAPSSTRESRTIVWVQRARSPIEYQRILGTAAPTEDAAAHVQSTWQQRTPGDLIWHLTGGFTVRTRENDLRGATGFTIDRRLDGPVPAIAAAADDTDTRRWSIAGGATWSAPGPPPRHKPAYGWSVDRASIRVSDRFIGQIGELADTTPARVWSFTAPGQNARHHTTTAAFFASDRLTLSPRMRVDASIRAEFISGRADGAETGISWATLLPSISAQWQLGSQLALVAGYRRGANQLSLDLLSFGDPSGATATTSRWLGGPIGGTSPGAVIDRLGPGTGGDPAFSRIDADLRRPTTDEWVAGVETRRNGWLNGSLIGMARRETGLLGVEEVGLSAASYTTVDLFDQGAYLTDAIDDRVIPVASRLPASFARNRYLLTNPDVESAAAYALTLNVEGSTARFLTLFGATASVGIGPAGNRGFRAIENTQDVLGELFTSPNAAPYARGRLFSDRAFTIKWATIYRFPGRLTVGAIARYQDGQPFSRLLLAPSLGQGPELVLADTAGHHRFTFTGTLDLRVQKRLSFGPGQVDLVVDAYNLFTRSNEVEEYNVTGPAFRTPTAIQPPHAVHLGVRFTF